MLSTPRQHSKPLVWNPGALIERGFLPLTPLYIDMESQPRPKQRYRAFTPLILLTKLRDSHSNRYYEQANGNSQRDNLSNPIYDSGPLILGLDPRNLQIEISYRQPRIRIERRRLHLPIPQRATDVEPHSQPREFPFKQRYYIIRIKTGTLLSTLNSTASP